MSKKDKKASFLQDAGYAQNNSSITTAEKLLNAKGLSKVRIGKYAILVLYPTAFDHLCNLISHRKKHFWINKFMPVFTGKIDNINVSICFPGWGSPSTVSAIEKLRTLGASTFIGLGSAGSLQEEIKIGDIVIPVGAGRGEGASRWYAPLAYPAVAHLEVILALKSACTKFGVKPNFGITWTTDAPYRETRKIVKRWKDTNALCIDMECSGMYIACSMLGLRACCLLLISDRISENRWEVTKHGVQIDPGLAPAIVIESIRVLEYHENPLSK